jgi:hypothetical protein
MNWGPLNRRDRTNDNFARASQASSQNGHLTPPSRIKRQETPDRDFAKHILNWLLYADRPLTAEELVHSYAIQHATGASNRDFNLPEDDVTSVCGGFVVMDPRIKVVRVVHESVQYHAQHHGVLHRDPPLQIVRNCLSYPHSNEFSENMSTEDEIECRSDATHSCTMLPITGCPPYVGEGRRRRRRPKN